MSDIWSVGGSDNELSVGKAGASEDWECSSSEPEDRPRKRAKNGTKSRRHPKPVVPVIDASQPEEEPEEEGLGDEDGLLAAYLSTAKHSTKGAGGKGKNRSPSPLLVDIDLDSLAAPGEAAAAAAAAGGGRGGGSKATNAAAHSPDPVRLASMQQRALVEQLAAAQKCAEQQDDDEIELLDDDNDDDGGLPAPAGHLHLTGGGADEDDALQLLDELGASQEDQPSGGGAEGRLPLVFQALGRDKVTVRVQPNRPLSLAMEKFSNYAAGAGWGTVSKFMFDGERLRGEDTPADLDMEADEVIDVYM